MNFLRDGGCRWWGSRLCRSCVDDHQQYNSEILYLIPVASNTKHFKNYIFKYGKGICFLEDTRLKFWINNEEYKKGAPMACCMIYFGENYEKFYKYFNEYGKCFEINI